MAYQIYTPMQAPTIPTSIFSSAAERGAKMGTLLDTPETAKIKGEILGKTQALEFEQREANIELTQERVESANIQQDRQREALEADKRANKLAPIKEGLGIVGDVMGLVSDFQGIQENSVDMEIKQNQLELSSLKQGTKKETELIKIQTANTVAKNAYTTAKQVANDGRINDKIEEALESNDPRSLLSITETSEYFDFARRNPKQALGVTEFMHQKGLINDAKRDEQRALFFGQEIAKNDLVVERSVAAARQKDFEKVKENFLAARNAVAPYLARDGKGNENNAKYIAGLKVLPKNLHEVSEDRRFVDLKSNPGKGIATAIGSYLIEGDTGRIIADLDEESAKPIQKILDANNLSNQAFNWVQENNRDQGKLGPNNQRKTENKEAPKQNIPDGGLKAASAAEADAATKRLKAYNVPEADIAAVKESGVSGRERADKEVVRQFADKHLPFINLDRIPESSLESADKAAEAFAKETIEIYKKASPETKKGMIENLKTKLPWSARKMVEWSDPETGYLRSRTGEPGVAEYYLGAEGLGPLKEVYKEEIIRDKELLRDEAMRESEGKQSPEEARKQEMIKAFRKANNPAEAARIAEAFKQKTNKDITEEVPVASTNAAKVNKATNNLQAVTNMSDAKKTKIENTINTVEINPLLAEASPNLKAVIAQESGGKHNVVSETGVEGIAQVTQDVEDDYNKTVTNPANKLDKSVLEDSIKLGDWKLRKMYSQFGNWKLAYAAYNGGEGVIDQAIKLAGGGNQTWEAIKPFIWQALTYYRDYFEKRGINLVDKWEELIPYPDAVEQYEYVFNQLA